MPHPFPTPERPGRRPRRFLHALTLGLVFGALPAPPSAAAQSRATFGGFAGRVDSRQIHSHSDESETRTDVVFGGFADAPTPVSWLHIVVEGALARRGGDYETTSGSVSATQSARVDYLGFAIMPTVKLDFGRPALYGSLGFTIESDIGTRSTAELAPLFTEPARQIVAFVAAAGIEVAVTQRWSVRLEARRFEQVSPAFRPTSGEVRHRSRELVVKVGMRPAG